MTERQLSEKLDELADILESITGDDEAIAYGVSQELRKLSNEKYVPGSTSWKDLKPKPQKKQAYVNTAGKKLPF